MFYYLLKQKICPWKKKEKKKKQQEIQKVFHPKGGETLKQIRKIEGMWKYTDRL